MAQTRATTAKRHVWSSVDPLIVDDQMSAIYSGGARVWTLQPCTESENKTNSYKIWILSYFGQNLTDSNMTMEVKLDVACYFFRTQALSRVQKNLSWRRGL